jgi:hypothetical protein
MTVNLIRYNLVKELSRVAILSGAKCVKISSSFEYHQRKNIPSKETISLREYPPQSNLATFLHDI